MRFPDDDPYKSNRLKGVLMGYYTNPNIAFDVGKLPPTAKTSELKEAKSHSGEEENGNADLELDEHDHEFMENGREVLTGTPDSNDKELEELMEAQTTPKTCIMHALSIVSTAPSSQPGSTPPPLAAVAPHTPNGDAWKSQGHTGLEQPRY